PASHHGVCCEPGSEDQQENRRWSSEGVHTSQVSNSRFTPYHPDNERKPILFEVNPVLIVSDTMKCHLAFMPTNTNLSKGTGDFSSAVLEVREKKTESPQPSVSRVFSGLARPLS